MALTGEINRGGAYTCSRSCFYKRLPKVLEAKNKNLDMSYAGVHRWIKRVAGQPSFCEKCKTTTGTFDWSNKSGNYKRDVEDWQRLCRKCHVAYDDTPSKRKITLLERYGTTQTKNTRSSNGQYIKEASLCH